MRNKLLFIAFALLLCVQASAQKTYPFRDTKLPDDKRVENLLSLLTLGEKISLLSTDLGVPRFGIPPLRTL